MSLKTRIKAIEKYLPERNNKKPEIIIFGFLGTEPSKEEERIALKISADDLQNTTQQ